MTQHLKTLVRLRKSPHCHPTRLTPFASSLHRRPFATVPVGERSASGEGASRVRGCRHRWLDPPHPRLRRDLSPQGIGEETSHHCERSEAIQIAKEELDCFVG